MIYKFLYNVDLMSKQKELTNTYFNTRSSLWAESVYKLDNRFDRFPTSMVRDDIILKNLKTQKTIKRVLDFGCGSGDMVFALRKRKYDAHGFDLAEDMIHQAENTRMKEYPKNSDLFWLDDVERYKGDASYDAAVATGVIEYLDQDLPLIKSMSSSLKKGGVAYIACRNKLFSAATANSYTLDELKSGHLASLIKEALQAGTVAGSYKKEFESVIANLRDLLQTPTKDLLAPKKKESVLTFPKGMVRRFHTPEEMAKAAKKAGLTLEGVEYFHMHPLPSQYEQLFPRFYNGLSLAFQPLGATALGAQTASGFVAVLRKS